MTEIKSHTEIDHFAYTDVAMRRSDKGREQDAEALDDQLTLLRD